jgi:hypothetical protein
MIANELDRAGHWIEKNGPQETRLCYERAMELTWYTVAAMAQKNRRRELLRFYEMLAALYIAPVLDILKNRLLQQTLISLDKDSFVLLNNPARLPINTPEKAT